MSRLVIQGGRVLCPASGVDETAHVLVAEGRVFGITAEVPSDWQDARVVDATDQLVVPGLICLRTHSGEPGEEWREDLASASRAAAAGGFTTICVTPDTDPVNDRRAVTELIARRSESAPGARLLPVGATTVGLAGEHLAEMADLRDAGCVAVSTGEAGLPSARMVRRVLEYARTVGIPVFTVAEERSLSRGTVIHEGPAALRLGMRASPDIGEAIGLYRDGRVAELAEWPIHVQRLSTAAGLEVLGRLRDAGVPVTADVTPHHLWFDESAVNGFDTRTRVWPPLRGTADVAALRAALRDGLIAAVATDHTPLGPIEKTVEFEIARPGTTGLETALGVLLELCRRGELDLVTAVRALTQGPAERLGRRDLGRIGEGLPADLAVVDPSVPVRVEGSRMTSRSRYTVFEGVTLSGRVQVTIRDGRVVWDADAPEPM